MTIHSFFLSNDEYVTLTGFNKDQFNEITESLTSLKNSAVRSIRTSVATFLLKLRTGLSNKMISVLIGLQEPQIQRIIYSVRRAFMTDFVPGNLGFELIYLVKIFAKTTLLRLLPLCFPHVQMMQLLFSTVHTSIFKRVPIMIFKDDLIVRIRIVHY